MRFVSIHPRTIASIQAFSICFFLFPLLTLSQIVKPWLDYHFPSVIANNQLWIGTPSGLYLYHEEEDSWSLFGSRNGLAGDDIRVLRWDEEYLWVITPEGLSQGDIRLNKWLTYTPENGLPGQTFTCIEFQGDYVWLGTDKGAARYDKLIQQWETFDTGDGLPDSLIYDIAVNEERVYFGSARGLAEYDVNFEKWRYFTTREGLPSDTIRYIYQTTDDLWLFTPAGPCLFNKQRYTVIPFIQDERLMFGQIRTFLADNTRFWAVSDSAVLNYDPKSAVWREYQESANLPSMPVNSLSLSAEATWFAARGGVAMRNEETGIWRYFDRTDGLSADEYQRVVYFRGKTFLINAETIDYYKPDEDRWYIHPLQVPLRVDPSDAPRLSLDRERGSTLRLNNSAELKLNGTRITEVAQYKDEYSIRSGVRNGSQETGNRLDIKAQLTLGADRTINGFYNNVDETQVMYGMQYRGANQDLLQEAQWGDIRFEKGKQDLAVSTGLFGGAFRAETGPRTEQYKRSRFSLKGFSGQRTTARETEFLTGNLKSGSVTKKDTDYMNRIFFTFEIPENKKSTDPGKVSLYLDDGLPGTDTRNTAATILAGIEGDYDRLIPGMDYALDVSGFVRMMSPVPEKATLILRMEGSEDQVLFHQGAGSACVNRYSLGIREILPTSFRLNLADTLGFLHALHEFGLDENQDGIVDPECMDYHEGILTFRAARPFPESVYSEAPLSVFRMGISFESELSFFTLKHDSLIRGSETVMIDGEILTPGQDYVLDYTVGSLLIVKEGVLAENSEIEIEYEYYFSTDARFHSAGLGLGLSDNCLIEANGFSFGRADNPAEETRGFSTFSEFKGRVGPWNIKLTPEFSRTQTDGRNGNAMTIRSDVSTEKLRLSGLTERIGREYRSLSDRKFQLGDLKVRDRIGVTFYPAAGLDVTGEWQRQEAQADNAGYQNREENAAGKILFSRSGIPAVSFSLRNQLLNTENKETRKRNLKTEIEYVVPGPILSSLSMQSMRFYWVWRHSRESDFFKTERITNTALYDNQYFRLDFSPAGQIQLNGYYRGLRMRAADGEFKGRTINQKEKIFADLVIDRIKGLNVNIRYQGDIQESSPLDARQLRQFSLVRRIESSLRIFPGQWFSPASAFSFQINVQPFWQGTLSHARKSLSFGEKFWPGSDLKSLTSSTDNSLVQFTGEWRPGPGWLFYTRWENQDVLTGSLNSRMNINVRRFNQKIEIRSLMNTLITLQVFRTLEDREDYSSTVRDNPMFWIEHRWSERFQTQFNLTYWHENRIQGAIREEASSISPLAGLTFRVFDSSGRKLTGEIRNDFSATLYRKETVWADQSQNIFSNNLSLDIYPASVFIARGRWVITYSDRLHSDLDMINNLVELRLTAQF